MDQPAKNAIYVCAPAPVPLPDLTRPDSPWVEGDAVVVSKIPFVEGSVTVESEFAISALPMDECWGHPYAAQYHYHGHSWKCFPDEGNSKAHSPLFGYAIDGSGIFGPRGENGTLVTNDDLDECHGHTHEVEWDGAAKTMYHYHLNN